MKSKGKWYPWPASALTSNEMQLLYLAREQRKSASQKPVTITQLLAEAVRLTFGVTSPTTDEAA